MSVPDKSIVDNMTGDKTNSGTKTSISSEAKINIEAIAIQLHHAIYDYKESGGQVKMGCYTEVIGALLGAGSEENLNAILAQKVKPPIGDKSYTAAEVVKLFEDFSANSTRMPALGAAFLPDPFLRSPRGLQSFAELELKKEEAQVSSSQSLPYASRALYEGLAMEYGIHNMLEALSRKTKTEMKFLDVLPQNSPLRNGPAKNTKFALPFEKAVANVRLYFAVKARDLKRVQEIIREYGVQGKNFLNYEQRYQARPAVVIEPGALDKNGQPNPTKCGFAYYTKHAGGGIYATFNEDSSIPYDKLLNTVLGYAVIDAEPELVIALLETGASIKPDCGIFTDPVVGPKISPSSESSLNGELLISKIRSMSVSDAELAKKLSSTAELAYEQPSGIIPRPVAPLTPYRDHQAARTVDSQSAPASARLVVEEEAARYSTSIYHLN